MDQQSGSVLGTVVTPKTVAPISTAGAGRHGPAALRVLRKSSGSVPFSSHAVRGLSLLLISVAVAGISAGCGGQGRTVTASVDPAVVSYLNGLLTTPGVEVDQFQTDIIEQAMMTGDISEADWKASNARVDQCLEERGVPLHSVYEGAEVTIVPTDYAVFNEYLATHDEANLGDTSFECSMHAVAVNSAYSYLNATQEQREPEYVPRAIHECLIEQGEIPESVTFEQFYADFTGSQSQYGPEAGEGFAACWNHVLANA